MAFKKKFAHEMKWLLGTAAVTLALETPVFASTIHKVTGNKAISHTSKVVIRAYRSKSNNKRIYTLKTAGNGKYTMKAKYYVHSFTKFTLQRSAKISGTTYYEVKSPSGYTGWIYAGYLSNPTTYYSKLTTKMFQIKAATTNNFYNHVPDGDYGKGKLTHYGKNYRNKVMTVTGEAKKIYKTHYYRLTYNGDNYGWIYGGALQKVTPASVYTQTTSALQAFDASAYSLVLNKNYFVTAPSTYGVAPSYPAFEKTANTIKYKAGNGKTSFKTDIYLPSTFKTTGDLGNAQSEVFDGSTLYVMNETKNTTTDQGFVVKYNLTKLRALAKSSADLSILKRAASNQINRKTLTSNQKAALKCVTIGPTFTTGHGQAMALNPKTGKLWFIGTSGTSTETSNIQELNKTTLLPDKKINFKMGQNQHAPINLTFDSEGNFYAFTDNTASFAVKNSVKIYKGVINSNNTVQINLVMQGLQYAAGTHAQSIGFNTVNQRLYLVSDGSLISVPVAKLGSLSASDVRAETFQTSNTQGKAIATREFEGLTFDGTGVGYLLTNKGVEIMKATSSDF